MIKKFSPTHPGIFIKEIFLKPLNLTITDAAKALGVSRKSLSELLNGKNGISPEMALRLAKAFNTTPESWLIKQMNYDIWRTKQRIRKLNVRRLGKIILR